MTPFQIDIPQEALDDLRERPIRTRWSPELPGAGWERGVPADYLRGLADYWVNHFDWRKAEAELNQWPQYRTEIDGQTLHFRHIRAEREDALPLLLMHDNPGGIIGLLDVLTPLSRHFHVVAPTMPGFGFSTPLASVGWTVPRTAALFDELMSRLGYERYGAHGGGGGANLSMELGRQVPQRLAGIHVNAYVTIPAGELPELNEDEQRRLGLMQRLMQDGLGFNIIMTTRPQTISHGLHDSPVGQAAWIVEKFKEWTDDDAELPEDAFSRDRILTEVSTQWFTGTQGSISQSYHDVSHDPNAWGPKAKVTVPAAFAVAAGDVTVRSLAEQEANVARWTEFDRGGAYLALEQPELLTSDVRDFFGGLH
ncbi:epoxide hydrolase [Nonomuraea turkmeniaca]|uniref:Epoxide hydrolase n=1 Tax=Nonomuraea turkmeniaca TaxID=103838 RepID=A0A5S4FFM0_9ACTN|nr:epoxide hydrolase N-terminal domain-containing protein [Nonomuraea turkmeniaca]TMR17655.1 epoxide hydrolase [Nonomuraea turkmeniaca]